MSSPPPPPGHPTPNPDLPPTPQQKIQQILSTLRSRPLNLDQLSSLKSVLLQPPKIRQKSEREIFWEKATPASQKYSPPLYRKLSLWQIRNPTAFAMKTIKMQTGILLFVGTTIFPYLMYQKMKQFPDNKEVIAIASMIGTIILTFPRLYYGSKISPKQLKTITYDPYFNTLIFEPLAKKGILEKAFNLGGGVFAHRYQPLHVSPNNVTYIDTVPEQQKWSSIPKNLRNIPKIKKILIHQARNSVEMAYLRPEVNPGQTQNTDDKKKGRIIGEYQIQGNGTWEGIQVFRHIVDRGQL